MSSVEERGVKQKLWTDAKAAVRAYAKDPSISNAAEVKAAWKALRTLDDGNGWQHSISKYDETS